MGFDLGADGGTVIAAAAGLVPGAAFGAGSGASGLSPAEARVLKLLQGRMKPAERRAS